MIQHPGVLALLLASALVVLMLLAAAGLGVQILRRWDLGSGAESQLALERRTLLVSTLMANALGLELLSLFLFIFTADALHPQFVGAMCAAGSLSADPHGYPALLAKVAACLGAGAWLVLHRADVQGHDYPLIRAKNGLLLALVPVALAEAWLQARYLGGLQADVMTSCCGSLFGQGRQGLAADLASLPPKPTLAAFWILTTLLVLAGGVFLRWRRGALPFGLLCLAFLPAGLTALISAFGLYIYELPTHHCPFCLLQREHGYVGYLLYAALLGCAIAGGGAGLLDRFQRPSLALALPRLQRRLAWTALACALAFSLVVGVWALVSPLKL